MVIRIICELENFHGRQVKDRFLSQGLFKLYLNFGRTLSLQFEKSDRGLRGHTMPGLKWIVQN